MSKVIYRPLGRVHRNKIFHLDVPASADITKVDIRPVFKGIWMWRKPRRFELDVFVAIHDREQLQRRAILVTNIGDSTAGNPFSAGPKGKWLGRFNLTPLTGCPFDHLDVWELDKREEQEPPELADDQAKKS